MKATDEKDNDIRELYFSHEFVEFYGMLQDKVKAKFEHTMDIIRTEYVLSTKFVKHLEHTDLYEMRVSVSTNEYSFKEDTTLEWFSEEIHKRL